MTLEKLKCDHCDGKGKFYYALTEETELCDKCYGSGNDVRKTITFIHSFGLENILAGARIVEAMKENPSIQLEKETFENMYCDVSGAWCVNDDAISAMKSPLDAIEVFWGKEA